MVKKIKNFLTDMIKIILLSMIIAFPIYFIGDVFDIKLLQWKHYEQYKGEYIQTGSSAIPLIIGSFISLRVLKRYGKISI